MADITSLILDDHDTFRRQFAELDTLSRPEDLERAWQPLAALLDVHAVAEEEIFYPELVRRGSDAEAETLDAVGDHNDIRDGIHDAARHQVGSDAWWEAVNRARAANTEHMGEEEDGALSDFRRHADEEVRDDLGRRFLDFKAQHADARGIDTSDKDPEGYVSAVEAEIAMGSDDTSLRIGSLKGR